MEEKFDYSKAIAELEEIAKKVEQPETGLDDFDSMVSGSMAILMLCRDFLKCVKEIIYSLEDEDED